MTSPALKHTIGELRHFKWLTISLWHLLDETYDLLSSADLRDVEDGHIDFFNLELRYNELHDVIVEEFNNGNLLTADYERIKNG